MLFTTVGLLVGAWTASVGATLVYQKTCFPLFVGTSPCISFQNGIVTLNRFQNSSLLLLCSALVDTIHRLHARKKIRKSDEESESESSCESVNNFEKKND